MSAAGELRDLRKLCEAARDWADAGFGPKAGMAWTEFSRLRTELMVGGNEAEDDLDSMVILGRVVLPLLDELEFHRDEATRRALQ